MASETDIANLALQRLGVKRITDLTEDSVPAREMNFAYPFTRDAELRDNVWGFAVKRFRLAADSTAPEWGRANSFTLPADFLALAPKYPEDLDPARDWLIENGKILTDDSAPLDGRYVARITDAGLFDPLFVQALASRLAFDLCEKITQSTVRLEALAQRYQSDIRRARHRNAIEKPTPLIQNPSWIQVRA